MKRRIYLGIEFVLLFFGIPTWIFLDRDFSHPIIVILPALALIFFLLRRSSNFEWRELIRWQVPRKVLYINALIILLSALLMLTYILLFDRESLFNLPRSNIRIYLALCLFYPVFSAFGQEIIYRSFLSRRYPEILKGDWQFVLASALTFSYMHIVYYDAVSMILTFIGGLYFARMYQLTRSVLFTSVLHGIYGILIFGVGLGQYFWLDIPL